MASSSPSIQQTLIGSHNIFSATGDVYVIHNPVPPAEAQTRTNLRILLNKVKQFWVKGVLEKSLYRAALLELAKETKAEAVDHPWESVLELPDSSQALPIETRIVDIFEQSNRALLILGEPGSGKTITLLELARDLISRAENDKEFSQPIPVIFNLSSWSERRQQLDNWLAEELSAKYLIPKRIGRPWLEQNHLLPLLDGLDEVRKEDRAACVEAINEFAKGYGLAGLAVCSRLEEYANLPVRLKLNAAIRLQPLTPDQVDEYLKAVPKLEALRVALQKDETLLSLAQSPLILNIMCLAYQDVSTEKLLEQAYVEVEERRRHLFDTYIGGMFKRRGQVKQPYAPIQTRRWLAWLAEQMTRHNQTIFFIEQLQPSWLPSRASRWVYTLVSRLITGLILGLLFGLLDVLILGLIPEVGEMHFGLIDLGVGVSVGLGAGFVDSIRFELNRKYMTSSKTLMDLRTVFYFFLASLVAWISLVILGGSPHPSLGALGLLICAPIVYGLRSGRRGQTDDIRTVESLSWSWHRAVQGGLKAGLGLILFIAVVVSFGALTSLIAGRSIEGAESFSGLEFLQRVLVLGLFVGAIFAPFFGLSGSTVEAKATPNQGIWLTLRNALVAGLIVGLVIGLIFGLLSYSGEHEPRLLERLIIGSLMGLALGLVPAFIWFGALDVIQHFALRFALWRADHMPWNCVYFFDYAVEHIFLRKVGGGYIFIHQMLMEHFAEMSKTLQ